MKRRRSQKDSARTATNAAEVWGRLRLGFFQTGEDSFSRWLGRAWAFALYLVGVRVWGNILNWGNVPFERHDWAEGGPRLAFLRDALLTGQAPLHMPDGAALRGVTDRFFSVADSITSPQVVFLRFMEPGPFVVVNLLLLFSVGFAGLLVLRRRYILPPVVFGCLFFVWSLNGHIVDHVAVGHIHWAGYFLVPWILLGFLRIAEGSSGWRVTAGLSVGLGLVFLQGAFHIYAACLVFLGLMTLAGVDRPATIRAMAFSLLVAMVRIGPIALEASRFDTEFLSGFTGLGDIVNSLIQLRPPTPEQGYVISPAATIGWWEVDHYIGIAGALGLAYAGVWLGLGSGEGGTWITRFRLPVLGMVILSLSEVFEPINLLGIPILSAQRVATRLFVIPLLMMAILGAVAVSRRWWRVGVGTGGRILAVGALVFLANDVWQHADLWRVSHMANLFEGVEVDLSLNVVSNHHDPPYVTAILVGAAISFLSLAFVLWRAARERAPSEASARQRARSR